MRKFAFAVALLAFSLPASAASVDDIVAANKAAMGGAAWDGKASVTVDFAYSGQAMTGTVHSVTDLTAPRYSDTYQIGPANGANGYDGSRAWDQDASGQVTYQESADQRQTAINEAYRRSNALWRAGRDGAQVTAATKTEGGRTYDVLTITPRDGKPFDAWIDADTHRVARFVEKQGTDTYVTLMTDYRAADGVHMAHTIHITNGVAKYDTGLTITKVAFGGALPASAFAIPAVTKLDFSVAGGKPQTTVAFALINNHIYCDAMLNGKGPYRLLVDTGGINIVTPTVARELGLKVEGQIEGRGAGEGRMDVGLTKIADVRVGDAIIKDQVFAVFPLEPFADVEGTPQSGIIGYEVFRRFVARIDYGKSQMTLIDPRHFDPLKAGTAVPFVFDHHIPVVKGSIDGIAGDFHIDTGARGELTLTKPFAAAQKARASHPKGVDAVAGWGVGGASRGYVTTMRELMLGPVRFETPVTVLASDKRGAFADASYAGNIGGGLLRQHVVTFDYGKQTMYFGPGGIAERDGYDRAGMWINRVPQGFKVMDVTVGSPVAQAGIKGGDIIVSVDGKPAKDIDLPALRKRLRGDAPGTTIRFAVMHAGATKDVAVTLRDLI